MCRLALLCLAALAAAASANAPLTAARNGTASRPPAGAAAPVDPYKAPAKARRLAATANNTSPIDPYAISSGAARAAYTVASRHLDELRKEALQLISSRLATRQPVTEYEVRQLIVRGMAARGLIGPLPTVAFGVHTADALYVPTAQNTATLQIGDPIVIALAGKIAKPEGVTASQTWCAIADKTVPKPIARAFATLRLARDRAIAVAANRSRARRTETDLRPPPSFSVGHGIYFPGRFGLRSEASIYPSLPKPEQTPPLQTAVQTLLP